MDSLVARHQREIQELRQYLEQATSLQAKPNPEILNLRKIQQHLSKQKNYTEAEKVQKVVMDLEAKNQERYLKQRDDRI
jgi:hypothetical protein